jgi:2-oxoglutarate dehydrogenase E2 component (dihydrolipoamide succinyltransferase)
MRRTISERMSASRRTAAHVHTVFEVDFTEVLRLKEQRNTGEAGGRLTVLSFVAKAVTSAIDAVPVINASIDGDRIVYKRDVNLGIAVALDAGLIVPVVKQAQRKSVRELASAIADLAARARSKRLTPGDVEGGTFTITNPGVFGSLYGLPIINQPQSAILCLGAVEKRAVVLDDQIVARPRAYLALGFDHRLIDGAVADRFMSMVKAGLESFDPSVL